MDNTSQTTNNTVYWPILWELDPEFVRKIRSFMVIGKNGDGALMVTEDGDGYWYGKMKFGMEMRQASVPTRFANVTNLVGMAHGTNHLMLLDKQGLIYAMGCNDNGQLGQGGDSGDQSYRLDERLLVPPEYHHLISSEPSPSRRQLIPTTNDKKVQFEPLLISSNLISQKKFISVKCGSGHCLALTECGLVFAWGDNELCQAGADAIRSYRSTPRLISQLKRKRIVEIACGGRHSLALTDSGVVYAWGDAENQQLGVEDYGSDYGDEEYNSGEEYVLNNRNKTRVPSEMKIELVVKSIAAGRCHSLLLTEEGCVWACGANSGGQLGHENDSELYSVLDLPPISQITAHFGCQLSVALAFDRSCYIWGKCRNNDIIKVPLKLPSQYFTVDSPFFSHSKQQNIASSVSVVTGSVVGSNQLEHRMLTMLDNPDTNPDVQFVVKKRVIHAHRCILKTASDYFERMFSETWCQKQSESANLPIKITIKDYSYTTFYAYLQFLYTGCFQILITDSTTTTIIVELFELANCYLETKLQQYCLDRMITIVSVENCCQYYRLSERYLLPIEFERNLIQFICTNSDKVFQTQGYLSLDSKLCQKLTDQLNSTQLTN